MFFNCNLFFQPNVLKKKYLLTGNLILMRPFFVIKTMSLNTLFYVTQLLKYTSGFKRTSTLWSNTLKILISKTSFWNLTTKFKVMWVVKFVEKFLRRSRTFKWHLVLTHTKLSWKFFKFLKRTPFHRVKQISLIPMSPFSKVKRKRFRSLKKKLKKKM